MELTLCAGNGAMRARAGLLGVLAAVSMAATAAPASAGGAYAATVIAPDSTGWIETLHKDGPIDHHNPFFQSLGQNGRSCGTCHLAEEAMSFTPRHAHELYEHSRGSDPLFAAVDGANCPDARQQSEKSHSLLLNRGLIRIGLAVPATAEYSLSVASDPYGCALRVDPKTGVLTASVYRRPLPTANLSFLSAIMFDGRQTIAPLTTSASFPANLRTDLASQTVDAVLTHFQAKQAPAENTVQSIVEFELGFFSAQAFDRDADDLSSYGANGGPQQLADESYYPGINDSLGADPFGLTFTPATMTLYSSWLRPHAQGNGVELLSHQGGMAARRRAQIAAGEEIFNTATFNITNVRGLNDNPALGNPATISGHCATCHDAPNVGHHSLPLPLDIGTGHTRDPNTEQDPLILAGLRELQGAALPVFVVSGCPNPFGAGPAPSFYTTDPGKALISGKCADFNRVKGPILRGLAARAPYFHNGMAGSLDEVVNFYNKRFNIGLTVEQRRQLAAFLSSL